MQYIRVHTAWLYLFSALESTGQEVVDRGPKCLFGRALTDKQRLLRWAVCMFVLAGVCIPDTEFQSDRQTDILGVVKSY